MGNQNLGMKELFDNIQKCHICKNTNPEKARRRLKFVNFNSDVFLIAEAMAPSQVRVSGVNYFYIDV